ncbi:MAG: hypothetical protein MJH10_20400, partial [Epibacterium sp.]|nr:hypothetical protein [Epibacterium sp.]NQX75830.1 hypothetical protein [Epibacterium sp.]
MTFGAFTDDNHYQLTTPQTVGAWWNYCFNDHTHVTVGPDGSGKSIIREPNIQQWNRPFRWFYLRDRATGEVWCPAWAPMGSQLDSYTCTHGPVSTTISSSKAALNSDIRCYVPSEAQAETWTWTLSDTSGNDRQFDVFVILGLDDKNFMGWNCFWDDEQNVFAKYAFPHHAHYDDYERLKTRPTHAAVAPTIDPTSWAGRLDDVTGGACAGIVPDAVAAGILPSQVVSNGNPVAALHWRVDVPANSSWRVDWLATLVDSTADAAALRQQVAADATAVDAELAKVTTKANEDEEQIVCDSPDADLNRIINRWMKKQITWQTRLWRNGISYPVRNILQDAVGYSLYAPTAALEPMRTVTAMQKQNGYVKVWTTRPGENADHPLVHKVHDDGGIWLAICCAAGLHAARDMTLLDEVIPYVDSGSATWYEHLLGALRFYDTELGDHGLVLMRDGDWTDPINGPGRFGKGESGWASMALAYACEQVAVLADLKNDSTAATECRERAERHRQACDDHLWGGDHYAYGFDDDGL